ncbi:reverse transcriptase family protein, partial [Vibrio parahaemolyticus]|nr:reverse transcriptase family protein [Vibrio parahaemolyticus]
MISLLNVEGKIFFSVVAQRLASYLERNSLIDTMVQKAGIPCFARCLEHTSMIWHQIQAAKIKKRDLHVVFLDLATAFGSVPHSLIWSAFDYFRVPQVVVNLVKAYFQDIRLCLSTAGFTTGWQRLEIGIMAGCTISPLAFTMAMEVIIRASKWVVGGERRQNGLHFPPVRAYMDDMTLVTTTMPCTKRLLEKVNKNLKWASMKIKPSKSRSISIHRGKLSDRKFVIDDEEIPTIREKSVKSLGRWYNVELNDEEQVVKFRKDVAEGLDRIDKSELPGKLKLWCLQFGLYPRLMWPLSIYEIPISVVERIERSVSSYIRKWLGAPRCLSSVALYGKGI